ncbi:MAG: CHAT domain-containing protein, partial [Pseudomonadota bacterium]
MLEGPFAARCATAAVAYFSCHGFFQHDQSGLELAGHVKVTVRDFLQHLHLPKCLLTVLCACETGQAVDAEYVGLPAAFLLAGSRCVLCTLWRVDDDASCLLLMRMLTMLGNPGFEGKSVTSLGGALREAQVWLRSASIQQIGNFFEVVRLQCGSPLVAKLLDK